ncbi:MAG TPA: hypothetical protein VK939_10260, partial [Longimicrobiales bacterium]|nr:hypothetical protein [Longimicrobiales bacterium]
MSRAEVRADVSPHRDPDPAAAVAAAAGSAPPAVTDAPAPAPARYDRSIVEGPLAGAVWKLAWPTMLTNIIGGLQG